MTIALLALVAAPCLAVLFHGVYIDHVRQCRRRERAELFNTPSPLNEVHRVIGGHRGPGKEGSR